MEKMKRLTALLCLLLALTPTLLHAQVVDVCAGDGTDSVTLYVNNYHYGIIQWQYSSDTVHWNDISDAHDTVYRFLPKEELYYRARMQYPNCPIDSSQITHIQLSPIANAGPDRILNAGYVIHLHANAVENARCMWQVIEGDYANLEDPTWRNSAFSGPDTLYRLTWTVANACGVSVDTVEIRYVVSRFYDAIVIVDTTDLILSDSSERANGVYRIVFNDPVPNVTDSTILVGIPDGGFLRRVVYFENHGDTCEMFTSQATMDDILEEGVIHFDADVAFQTTATRGNGNYVRIDHVPTRAEILTDSIYQSGKICFYEYPITLNGEALRRSRDLGELQYNWTLPHLTLHGEFNIDDIDVDFNPNPIWEFHKNSWRDGFNFGLYDASATIKFKLHINSSVVFKPIKRDFGELATRFVFVVFGVPVEAKAAFCMTARGGMNVSLTSATTLDMEIGSGLFTAAIEYNGSVVELKPLGKLRPVCRVLNESDILKIDGELFFEIGPKFDLHFYEILGPYVDVLNRLSFKLCRPLSGTDHQPFVTWGDRWVGDIGVNVEIPIVEKNLLDIKYRFKPDAWANIHKIPCKIERASNMNLHFNSGNWLTEPIQVKVWANGGNLLGVQPANNVKVKFQTSNGMLAAQPSGTGVTSTYVVTDNNGIAQIYWKPSSNQINRLSAILNDCDGNPIEGSPINFYAYNGPDCSLSTLSLEVEKKDDGSVALKVSRDPESSFYWYSDGLWPAEPVTFPNFNAPPITLIPGKTYYVRDDNNCVASATYHVMTPTSAECDLLLLYNVVGTSVNAMVLNGSAPYHFYVDYADNVGTGMPAVDITPLGTDYLECTWNQGIPGHSYKMFVTDANGCSDTVEFSISDPVTTPVVVTNAAYNYQKQIYDTIMGIVVDDGNSPILCRGVEWSLSADMTNASNVWSPFSDDGMGAYTCAIPSAVATPGTTYYACAYATNSKGTAYGDTISITVPGSTPGPGSTTSCGVSSVRANETGSNGTITAVRDHENNSYAVVQIGNQCWLKENMRCTTSPTTGANMVENPAVAANMSATVPRAYYYDNNPANAANGYGLLYNWPASMDGNTVEGARGICPEGWHLPTDAEWTTLMNNAVSIYQPGMTPSPAFGSQNNLNLYPDVEGANTSISQLLTDNSSLEWSVLIAQIETLFQSGGITAAQYNNYMNLFADPLSNSTGFGALPAGAYFGTSASASGFYGRGMDLALWSSSQSDGDDVWVRGWHHWDAGVGRVKDNFKSTGFSVRCLRNNETGNTPTPPTPPTTSCGVSSIRSNETGSNGTITAVRDHQNNSYAVVQIGGQCWLKENMRCTTSPTTGANMVENPANSSNTSSTERRAYYYDNNPANVANGYGLLYNWPAAMDGSTVEGSRGICPEGWHVPSNAEWVLLNNYVGSQNQYVCGNDNEHIAKALASTNGWNVSPNLCAVGNTSSENNATEFSAIPVGIYDGVFWFGDQASFWSATQYGIGSALRYNLSYYEPNLWNYGGPGEGYVGCSIRCLRDTENGDTPNPPSPSNPTSCGVSSVRSNETGSNGTITAVQDHENNSYAVVQIGNQCWLKENMRCTTSPTTGANMVQNPATGNSSTVRRAYYYDNNPANAANGCGLLYNWHAAVDGLTVESSRGICPEGWHVPTDEEWTTLMNTAVNIYQPGTTTNPVFGSLNMNGQFEGINTSISQLLSDSSRVKWTNLLAIIELYYQEGYMTADIYNGYMNNFLNPNPLGNATGFSAFPAGLYSSSYFSQDRGACFWSSSQHSSQYGSKAWSRELYYIISGVQRWAEDKGDAMPVRCLRNSEDYVIPTGDGYPCPNTPTVTDFDNNTYITVQIGNQCWMKENLRTTHYSDGTNIPAGNTNSYSQPYRYFPNEDGDNVETYGYLYNWSAVMHGASSSASIPSGVQGVCPIGWHVPSNAEWTQLINYVGNQSQYVCGTTNTNIAKALASTEGWNYYSYSQDDCLVGHIQADNNTTRFSAFPAGYYSEGIEYAEFGKRAFFWSSTGVTTSTAKSCYLYYKSAGVSHFSNNKDDALSVRCLRDADNGDTPTPPSPGSTTSCEVSSVRSNETGSDGTITAVRDHENNSYTVVQIGNQCWLKENMRATKYSDGTDIPEGNTHSNTNPYRYSPNNDASNVPAYGYLYNWPAIMKGTASSNANPSGVQGICPVGWHVPSDAEWTQLTNYVSSQSQYWCGGVSTSIAKALAAPIGWNNSTNTCALGNDPSSNNSTGFSVVPAGAYNFGTYYGTGNNYAYFWSSFENGDGAYCRRLDYLYDFVSSFSFDKSGGYSVRCLRD